MSVAQLVSTVAIAFAGVSLAPPWRGTSRGQRDVQRPAVHLPVLHARHDERLRERARVARELHDTVLQSVQSIIFSLQAMASRPSVDDALKQQLTETLQRAEVLMTEGLDRIMDMRPARTANVDLAKSLAAAWRDLEGGPELTMLVEGNPRALEPAVGDEISLIGREALSNALRHAKARRVEVQIIHGAERLVLRVRDDGVGMDRVSRKAGQAEDWGLQGMRERASFIGGRLHLWSAPDAGTEIELSVPAETAYRCGPQVNP